ncbi:hypothetical protein [Crocinitomix catalasitica]|uniref:hypothetical protein n=1 Tax=Crocinitomix catalasitica TaxID=184607 RepID=UPI00056821C0|nr:hypothetical protein [Crocinitomix catalasitica]
MRAYELKDFDTEDLEDLILKIGNSLDIRFEESELAYVKTFEQLFDHIKSKIDRVKTDDCTVQQAFYKLRNTLSTTLNIEKKNIKSETLLVDILPKQTRIQNIKEVNHLIGFKIDILRPHQLITSALFFLLITALVGLFFNWQYGIIGIVFCLAGFWISNKMGAELDLKTVGEVAEKITRDNYTKSRRNLDSYNEREIDQIMTNLFSEYFMIDKSKLSRNALK